MLYFLSLLACPSDPTDGFPPSQLVRDDTGETETEPEPDPAHALAWQAVMDAVSLQVSDSSVPGMAVAVVVDGELYAANGAGVAGWESEVPVDGDTLFRWASVSKMHTATAVMQLVEAGSLDLDDPIANVVPEFSLSGAHAASDLTLHQMLTHSTALPDVLVWSCDRDDGALEQYFSAWSPALHAEPGVFYNYSNSGFSLAGRAMEVATGMNFVDLMDSLLLEPAGMKTATFDADEAVSLGASSGTGWWNNEAWIYDLQEYDCGPSRPPAWLHGSVVDLAHLAMLHLDEGGDLISSESALAMRDQMDSRWYLNGDFRVGYGLFSYPYKETTVVMHDGWVTGFVSAWAIVPESDFGVVVVANADWADPYAIMDTAIDQFLGLTDVQDVVEWETDPSTWSGYTGSYFDPEYFGNITVTLEGETLYADFTDYDLKAELHQYNGDAFWFFGWDYYYNIRFIQDDTGIYKYFVERYGVGTRTDSSAIAASESNFVPRMERLHRPGSHPPVGHRPRPARW